MFPLLFVLHPHQHGWRWAIYRVPEQEMLANPRAGCINAGFELTKDEANLRGQDCLASVTQFAAAIGVAAPVTPFTYNTDLTPPDVPLSWHLKGDALQMGV
jgi:hypothetical protein